METPTDTPDAEAPDARTRTPRRVTLGRALALVVCLSFVAMWAFVFASQNRYTPAGYLEDRSFPEAAEPICAAARDEIDALPRARDAASPEARAEVVEVATDRLDRMQQDLRAAVPAGDDGRWIRQWVDDWSIYIEDRRDYAAELASGEDAEFLVTEKYGTQLSKSLDNFAQVNRMSSCKVPGDV